MTDQAQKTEEPAAPPPVSPEVVAMQRGIAMVALIRQALPAVAKSYPAKELAAIAAAKQVGVNDVKEALVVLGASYIELIGALNILTGDGSTLLASMQSAVRYWSAAFETRL